MKRIIKFFITSSVLLVIAVAGLFANPLENKNSLGVYFLTIGNSEEPLAGLQYQREVTDRIGLVFDGSIFYDRNTYLYSDILRYNVNVQVDFNLYSSLWSEHYGSRLFVYVLAGHLGGITNNDSEGGILTEENKYWANFVASVGFGFDFMLFEHLSIPVQFGFSGQLPNNTSAGVCIGMAIRYAF